ncbi:MAG: DUF5076 domain-containing protein [Rhodoplanes sp.]
MPPSSDKPIYDALAIPNEAVANGGVEILRAGLIDDELYVTARHAFKDPAQWGEVLADITRRLALLYSMETDLSEAEARIEIEEAYAAEMGAEVVPDQASAPAGAAEGAPRPKRKAPSAARPRRKRASPPPSESEG